MTSVLLIATLLFAAAAPGPAGPVHAGRTEIERMVVRGTAADQVALRAWLETHDNQRRTVEAELLAAGFRKEPPSGGCFSYAYVGKEAGTRDDRTASVTYCNGKLVWVSIVTWLPFEKNLKGPLPSIKPAPGRGN